MSKGIATSVTASLIQTIITAGTLFFVYRYITTNLGVEQLGIWSVVLAGASMARLADLGLGSAVIRFIAQGSSRGDPAAAADIVDTTTVLFAGTMAVIASLLYLLLPDLLQLVFEGHNLEQAEEVLPLALICLWLNMLASVSQGALDGCQRVDLRAGLVVSGHLIFLTATLAFVPIIGLMGLATAQVIQALFMALAGRKLVALIMPLLSMIPRRWNTKVLKEMLSYGANVQAVTIFALLLDPITKFLTSAFGGPAAAGYFEIASQVVQKTRSIIVGANQAIIPHVVSLAEKNRGRVYEVYRDNLRLLVVVTFPAVALLAGWEDVISLGLIGRESEDLAFLIVLFAFAWAINIFAGPAYFTNLGLGDVRQNTLVHIVMGALNLSLGWLLGTLFGARGVAIGYATALSVGSLLLIGIFHSQHKIDTSALLAAEHRPLALSCVLVVALGSYSSANNVGLMTRVIEIGLSLLLLILAVWIHPVRSSVLMKAARPSSFS